MPPWLYAELAGACVLQDTLGIGDKLCEAGERGERHKRRAINAQANITTTFTPLPIRRNPQCSFSLENFH